MKPFVVTEGQYMSRQGANRSGLERERTRRARSEKTTATTDAAAPPTSRRDAALRCAWCGGAIDVKPVGRIPKWCSASCRQRALEQRRAAASGRAAVEVVERIVQVVVERKASPRHDEWAPLLRELAVQLNTGRIYPRDIAALAPALCEANAAFQRNFLDRHPGPRRP
jgi:hypothetical protein